MLTDFLWLSLKTQSHSTCRHHYGCYRQRHIFSVFTIQLPVLFGKNTHEI